ncbi:transglycosylase SLT domain-containing protein [Comamonadaceae bacterium BS-T2-15]|uniref:Transglycosylase SLT domain-containing protein n=2 Tax=Scleromatobacter humisilvae TaxID=2897159 RepID=A0A9X1YHI3_9BURK|nr:transglycosylase SLT domain-containing protein [Scleromatobacter humisilvae]MCK9686006.1 transglycosylase SLT domain-containing protein [Scleromatobacter humisilvae]
MAPAETASAAEPAASAASTQVATSTSGAAGAPAAAASDAEAMDADDDDDTDTAAKSAPAVLPPYDPLQPEAKVNLDNSAARSDLWHRVRDGFAIPDLDNAEVKVWEQWYSSRPDYVGRMTARGSKYLFHITQEVERRHMPTELALLPFTESAFNPQAMSVAKASGMWQFVSATGKDFDLKQNIFRDDRRDVLSSTRAALDYLQRLHDMFGDWRLALAAYNCGQGTVQRAIARNLKAGLPTDYESLSLPVETRQYVPKLQAVKNIVMHPDAYGLTLPPVGNHPYFLSVPIERDIDVDTAAKLANVPIDEFRMLNPQLDKPVILAAGTPQVLLPYDNADDFVRAVKSHQGALATWTAYVVGKTMRPADAAKAVGMSEAELREVNHIPARMLVKSGSTLLVPRSAQHIADVSVAVADSAAMALAPDLPPTRRVNMRIAKGGETVAAVAKRWHVSPTEVATWNHVKPTAKFAAGSTAVLFLPRSTSLARAPAHPAPTKAVANAPAGKAVVAKAPAAKTRVAQTPNARSGAHVAVSKAPRRTVVAHKAAGTPAKPVSKTKVAQP